MNEHRIEDLDVEATEAEDVKGGAFDAFRSDLQKKADAHGIIGVLAPGAKSSIIAI